MQGTAGDNMPGGESAAFASPTISAVLAAYLADEEARLAAKTFGLYADVIELLQHSLNGYAANSLDKDEYKLWEELFNAEGDQHREFCEIFGPEHILPNIGEFLSYFMVSKVMAGQDLLRASGTVAKKLAKWLADTSQPSETPPTVLRLYSPDQMTPHPCCRCCLGGILW